MRPDELLHLDATSVWHDVWRRLARASRDPRHAFRLPVVATRCPKRGIRARTVVLRETDPGAATLTLYTDRRAGKLAGLALEPRISWCFYDPRHRVQVRAETRAAVHVEDGRAREAWETQGSRSRRLYRSPAEPGSPLPDGWEPDAPGPDDAGFENFAVVDCEVEEMEWLVLARERHRRLRFGPSDDGSWRATALVP